MIKLVATDIDGTILYEDKASVGVKKCIKKLTEHGIKVILVTGRMHCSAKHVAQEFGLETPIISYQGGLVKEFNDTTLYQKNLPSNYAKEIIAWARAKNVHINLYIDDKLYVENDNEIIKYYASGKYIKYTVCSFDDIEIENVNKILAIDLKNPDRVTGWVEELKQKYPQLFLVKSTPYFCEIGNGEAKKSLGLKFLCDKLGIKKEEVLTIGDQDNDIDLVKAGGIGVAMGNASVGLKSCADYITDTVQNDGFVKAMEKFVFSV